ncbi:MAG: hypothetical protein AAGD25_02780 [Cyanobacteria bacterium P01_F01_bin.150]
MSNNSPVRPQYQFESSHFYFSLLRLTDNEYQEFRTRSFPIRYDTMVLWSLRQKSQNNPNLLMLPKLLILLEKEFGRSSKAYDSWKQGFYFPFLLKIQKPSGPFYYLLVIADYRGGIDFSLYRVIDDAKFSEKEPEVYQSPIEDELSDLEIAHVVSYIWGFYKGYANSYFAQNPHITPFFRYIASENLVYGYWDDQFFERVFEDDNSCRILVKALDDKYGKSSKSVEDEICQTQEMILKIIT